MKRLGRIVVYSEKLISRKGLTSSIHESISRWNWLTLLTVILHHLQCFSRNYLRPYSRAKLRAKGKTLHKYHY